jgi:predicted PurR-regulated permease PerM
MVYLGDGKKGVVIALILIIFVLTFLIIKPIVIAIIFGLLFAYIFAPVYKKIYSKTKMKNISALVLILALIILIAIPLIYLAPQFLNQVRDTYVLLQDVNFSEAFRGFLSPEMADTLSIQITSIIEQLFPSAIAYITRLIWNFPMILLQLVVFLFTFFFATRDHEGLKNYASKLSPFSQSTGNKFSREFKRITNAIVYGQILIGIIQGLLLGLGFYIIGVKNVLILTFVASIVGIIPVLGTWLIWLPAGIFLIAINRTFAGIFIMIYGALFVSTIDNLLRPYILSRSSSLPVVASVIGTIGGLYAFGIAGLILGPLIIAYFLIIIDFYQQGKLSELFEK